METNIKKAQMILSLEGDRLFISGARNAAVSVKVDITPVYFFLKEMFAKETNLIEVVNEKE